MPALQAGVIERGCRHGFMAAVSGRRPACPGGQMRMSSTRVTHSLARDATTAAACLRSVSGATRRGRCGRWPGSACRVVVGGHGARMCAHSIQRGCAARPARAGLTEASWLFGDHRYHLESVELYRATGSTASRRPESAQRIHRRLTGADTAGARSELPIPKRPASRWPRPARRRPPRRRVPAVGR
jgi:hypothetical protein